MLHEMRPYCRLTISENKAKLQVYETVQNWTETSKSTFYTYFYTELETHEWE